MSRYDQPGVRRFSYRVLGTGLVAFTLVVAAFPSLPPWPAWWWTLAAVSLFAERRSLYLAGYGALNFGEGLYLSLAMLGGPVPAALAAAGVGFVADTLGRKQTVVRRFNLGWALLTYALAGAAWRAAGVAAMVLTYALVAGLLQALAQRHFEGLPLRATLRDQFRYMVLAAPAALGFAWLGCELARLSPWAVLLLAFPVEVFSAYARTRELNRQLEQAYKDLEQAQVRLVASGRQTGLAVMAAGIAHEINNPLGALRASLHILARSGGEQPALQLALKAFGRCEQIVGRMLKYAHGGAGIPSRGADLRESFNDALVFLGRSLEGLEIDASGLDGLPGVAMEPGDLVQVLTNLLTNACDASRRGGRIVLTGRRLENQVEVSVRDSGEGIAPEVRERIWDPFFTTRPVGQGTGLGLPIISGLLRNCAGSLELVSTGPDGTTFAFRLPVWR